MPNSQRTPNSVAAAPKDKPDVAPAGVIDQAFGQLERDEQRRRTDDQDWEATAFRTYLGILSRIDRPNENDAELLREIARDFNITRDQICADLDLIRAARRLEGHFDSREDAHRRALAAGEAYREMEKRHREEEKRLFLEKENAHVALSRASNAAHELEHLKRRRPQLFTQTAIGGQLVWRLLLPEQK